MRPTRVWYSYCNDHSLRDHWIWDTVCNHNQCRSQRIRLISANRVVHSFSSDAQFLPFHSMTFVSMDGIFICQNEFWLFDLLTGLGMNTLWTVVPRHGPACQVPHGRDQRRTCRSSHSLPGAGTSCTKRLRCDPLARAQTVIIPLYRNPENYVLLD